MRRAFKMPSCLLLIVCRLVQTEYMNGVNGVGHTLLINNHDSFGVEGDEVSVWHQERPTVGQLKGKRLKSVLKPLLYLLDHHGATLASLRIPIKRFFI